MDAAAYIDAVQDGGCLPEELWLGDRSLQYAADRLNRSIMALGPPACTRFHESAAFGSYTDWVGEVKWYQPHQQESSNMSPMQMLANLSLVRFAASP